MTQKEIEKISDRELHQRCQTCGANIRKLQREFAGYLHEVERRKLYKRFNFYSIHEYAAKLAGMSYAVIDEILAVHKKLEDKPVLKNLISEHGWTKLKIVASSATPENQEFWAEKVKEMSKTTLETYVKELRRQGLVEAGSARDVQQNAGAAIPAQITQNVQQNAGVAIPVQITQNVQTELFTNSSDIDAFNPGISKPMDASQKSTFAFKLDGQTETNLRIFKQKLEKQTKEPQDWNRVIKKLLEIAAEHENCGKRAGRKQPEGKNAEKVNSKAREATQVLQCIAKQSDEDLQEIQKSLPVISKRHIPSKVKHFLVRQYGGKCAYPWCKIPRKYFITRTGLRLSRIIIRNLLRRFAKRMKDWLTTD